VKLATIAKPVPTEKQALIRVRAASVNPYDWHFMRGEPRIMRFGIGLRKPESSRLGVDFAGTVEAVGKDVTQFKPGDEVFGGRTGAFAQYVCASERGLAMKPANVSFEQAAAINMAGLTALQGLRDKGNVQQGTKVLINGASGGIGTLAVQLGKRIGGIVNGVCSTRNVELVQSLGADRVIDYTKEDYTSGSERYDVIIDLVGNRTLSENRRILQPNGKYVMIGGQPGKWIAPMGRALSARMMSWFVSQDMTMMLAEARKADLATLADLVQSGKLRPVIDRSYGLEQVADAIRYVEEGHARGKVVIKVE
jgi:NADPH:quinone reductase-like Zn-dependent oxidoreductase